MESVNNYKFYQELRFQDKANLVTWHCLESASGVSNIYQERTGCDEQERVIQQQLLDGWNAKLYYGYFTGVIAKVALVGIGIFLGTKKIKNMIKPSL